MHESVEQFASARLSLGPSHGYRFEGDTAILHADLAIEHSPLSDNASFALQLWACDEPYNGGTLRGIKVAEAPLSLANELELRYLEAEASAQLPPVQREYSMVLVLASRENGAYYQVHDFSNYPMRQGFHGPHLEGAVGYRVSEQTVVLEAERVSNPRSSDNLSGTLSLELWALAAPYEGGEVHGTQLAQAELGSMRGDSVQDSLSYEARLVEAPAGQWYATLMLREWTDAFGYVTRDYCNFAEAYQAPSTRLDQEAGWSANDESLPALSTPSIERWNTESSSIADREDTWSEPVSVPTAIFAEEAPASSSEFVAPEPVSVTQPEPVAVKQAEPVAVKQAEPVAVKQAEPVAVKQAEPVAVKQAEPVAVKQAEPVVVKQAEPVVVKQAEPVVVKQAEPVAAKQAEPVAAKQAEPVAAKQAEPVAAKQAEPVAAKQAERVAPEATPRVSVAATKPAVRDAAPVATPPAVAVKAPLAEAAPSVEAKRVSLQHASVEELEAIPGLNRKLATAIVQGRPFESVDKLIRVRGIGDKLLRSLRHHLTA